MFKYRVVIMDDEKPIVEGLQAFIDWEEEGFTIAGVAYNGEDGLRIARQVDADVVLTDIRMPLLSGHGVIEQIKAIKPECEFIVLSGYSNFDYAQQALNSGVVCYLLKPVQEEELRKNLRLIKKKLDQRRSSQQELTQLRQRLEMIRPVVRERYLCDLVTDELLTVDRLRDKWNFLNLGFDLHRFGVLTLEVDGLRSKYHEDIEKILLVRYQAGDMVEKLTQEAGIGVAFRSSRDRVVVLCCEKAGESLTQQQLRDFAAELQSGIRREMDESISVGIGNIYETMDKLHQSYEEANHALDYKLLYGRGCLITFDEISASTPQLLFPIALEKEMFMCVEIGDEEGAQQRLRQIFGHLSETSGHSPEAVYALCLNFLVSLSRCAAACGIPADELNQDISLSLNELRRYKTAAELLGYMEGATSEVAGRIRIQREQQQKGVVGQVQQYVEEHYAENLSLEMMVERFYINPSYLSQLFKKKTGKNFIDYLTEIRIENAKRLLRESEWKVYEIGTQVGYGSARYFSQIFEKKVGMTPTEYRQAYGKTP